MPISIETVSVESAFGVTVDNLLIVQDPPPKKLLVILPGRIYTVEAPLLHYLCAAGLQRGFDVLKVRYGFHLTQEHFTWPLLPQVIHDATEAVNQALKRGYETVVLVGKSLGSPVAAELSQKITAKQLYTMLLTPVHSSPLTVADVPTLAVVGTADWAYKPDCICDTATLTWKVYEGLDHALEYPGDWEQSLHVMKDIVAECDRFLEDV